MPNLLVHSALQAGVFGVLGLSLTAVFAGCIIPDIPWIVRRASLWISADPIEFEAYFLAQASLFYCALPCLGLGLMFKHWQKFALTAWLGCAIHLGLDSLQDKWGNGVHLLAPLDWTHFQIGWFSLESDLIMVLTAAGIVPFFMVRKAVEDSKQVLVAPGRITAIVVVSMLYFATPGLFYESIVSSNSRYLQTLENENRIGKALVLDREPVTRNGNDWQIVTHTREPLRILNPSESLTTGTFSMRGEFVEQNVIQVKALKQHSGFRDIASYLGVALVFCWMASTLLILPAYQRKTAKQTKR